MSLDVDFDSVVTRFERSWEEHLASNCDVPRIDDFLPSAKHLRDSVLLELSTIDLERRLRFDKQGRVEDYLQSYPEMRKDPDAIGQLIKTEFEFRLRDEPGLNIQEYSGRFPVEFSSIKAELETLQLEALGPSRRTVGEYELVQQLGAGTMGRVYKAYQRRLDRIVAIKMIRSGKLASQHEKDRFQVEIKAAAGLDHPFIVRILEAGEHQDDLFFAMDYVDGTSLSELAQANPLEPRHAAKYVAQIAEGIEYAHQQNVLHRDLKPANILVDERDTIRIADFGLAKRLEADTRFTRTGDVLGTPSYMAPEQAKAQADAIDSRSDVYSIGAVAYELLTGRPPFQAATVWATLRQVVSSDPVPPRALNGDVPVELETICLKCLEKKPAHRFQSAAELRAELDRFINDERIVSRRPGLLRKAARWSGRNPRYAVLLLILILGLASILAISVSRQIQAQRIAAQSLRESAMQELQKIRLMPREAGWSAKAWQQVDKAEGLGRNDELKDQAAATLVGLDAFIIDSFLMETSSVSFGPAGKQLLASGLKLHGAKIWNEPRLVQTSSGGIGPVTYSSKGIPLQIRKQSPTALNICDLNTNRIVHELVTLPGYELVEAESEVFPIVTSPRAGCVATISRGPDGKKCVLVWTVHSNATPTEIPVYASALAISPDEKLLATGVESGDVIVWQIESGTAVWKFSGRMEVTSVEFGRDPRRPGTKHDPTKQDWVLGVGDVGSNIVIHDLQHDRIISKCHGSLHQVFALAFSPDGQMLASTGRSKTHIWDVATGRKLLSFKSNNTTRDLAFSADGMRLAVGGVLAHTDPGKLDIWELRFGHGIRTLYGLGTAVASAWFSPNGKLVAGLSHDWKVGVWDVATGFLQYVFEVPQGETVDNAGIAFSLDGQLLAFAAGRHASLWNVQSGAQIETWDLPEGRVDRLGFYSSQDLMLYRLEGLDVDALIDGQPKVCRIRNLLREPSQQHIEIGPHFDTLYHSAITLDGSVFVVEGKPVNKGHHLVVAIDGLKGTVLWSLPTDKSKPTGHLSIDPTGNKLRVHYDDKPLPKFHLYELKTQRFVRRLQNLSKCLGPNAELFASPSSNGYTIYCGNRRLVKLGIDAETALYESGFSPNGRYVCWGNSDGTVYLCDLETIREQLSKFQLAWSP